MTGASVSTYESGLTPVPAEVLLRLANLALDYHDSLRFMEAAGLTEAAIQRVYRGLVSERKKQLGLPSVEEFVSDPAATRQISLGAKQVFRLPTDKQDWTRHGLAPGDCVVYDEEDSAEALVGSIAVFESDGQIFLGALDSRINETTGAWEMLLWPPGRSTPLSLGRWLPDTKHRKAPVQVGKIPLYPEWRPLGRLVALLKAPREGKRKR